MGAYMLALPILVLVGAACTQTLASTHDAKYDWVAMLRR